jgi:hypothetical protein
MLTNLSWLAPGAPWPPAGEKKRLEQYAENEKFFLTEHNGVWKTAFKKLAEKCKKSNYDADTVLNYHQILTKKTADFVCGEPPKIETEGNTDQLVEMLDDQKFFAILFEGFLDVSMKGNGILKFVDKEVSVVSPSCWFPIVDSTNLKKIKMHVIAYLTEPDAEGNMTRLYAEIHTPGSLETRCYEYNHSESKIGAEVQKPVITSTNLEIPAVHALTNLTHSGSIYGLDDYNIINSIVKKIMWRLHCADTILDKHSEPSMSGPESALEYDEKFHTWYVPLGNYFKRAAKEDPAFEYVTWDGNLESSYKEIELLLNQLYILTEMGQAFADAGGGNDSSGTALKLRMVSPRVKAQRLAGINNATVKKIIFALATLNGIKIDYKTLTIHWCDGLPIDEVEQIEMLTAATGQKPVMSQYTALKKRGLSDAEVKEELKQIHDEDAAAAPVVNVPKVVETADGDE